MDIEEEILYLTKIWMKYIAPEHHKDRDCKFYIKKIWAYGDEPYYEAYHYGYVAAEFEGTKCDTLEEAQEELRDFLYMTIYKEEQWLIDVINKAKNDEDGWSNEDLEERQGGLDRLSGWNDYRKKS